MPKFLVVMIRTCTIREHAVVEVIEGSEYYAEGNAVDRAVWEQDATTVSDLKVISRIQLTPK